MLYFIELSSSSSPSSSSSYIFIYRPDITTKWTVYIYQYTLYPFCCTVRRHGHFCRKIYGSSRSSTCVSSVWSSGYAGMTLSETQKLSTGPAFPVFGMSSPGDETHCSAMWWDSMITRQLTAHYHRSHQQEPAPVLVLVGGDGQDARAIHGSSRSVTVQYGYTLQHSCWMVQGSSSWPLWVDATDLCCLRDLMVMMMSTSDSLTG